MPKPITPGITPSSTVNGYCHCRRISGAVDVDDPGADVDILPDVSQLVRMEKLSFHGADLLDVVRIGKQ